MRKNIIFKLFIILAGILVMMFNFGRVQAVEIISAFSGETVTRETIKGTTLGISSQRETGNKYTWNPKTTGEAKTVWKIANIINNSRDYNNLYYCLNASRGFGITDGNMAEGATDDYTSYIDMKNSNNITNIKNYAGGSLDVNYNKILWILDNLYIPTGSSSYKNSNEYKLLMNKASINIENNEFDLTEEQIEVVQQMAIWYYTNEDDIANYHLSSGNLPMMYLNDRQLSDIYFGTTIYGEQITGIKIYNKMNALYKYFINNALDSYSVEVPTLNLDNSSTIIAENTDKNYVVGPFKLTGENTNSIKEIIADVNVDYTLLNSSKVAVNDWKEVVGTDGFYLQISKDKINDTMKITIDLTYKSDVRNLTLLTNVNEYNNTQPVVIIENVEKNSDINTEINIELAKIIVEKIWQDNNDQDGVRPTNVKVQLYKDNLKFGNVVELNKSNNWTYTWNKLLTGSYKVKELNNSGNELDNGEKYNNDYTVEYKAEGNKTIITNKHISEVIEIDVAKIWDDNNNKDGKRPENITVNLLADGIEVDEKTFSASSDYSFKFSNLPKYKDGKRINYTVTEDTVEEYTTTYSTKNIANTDDISVTITNTYIPVEITGKYNIVLRKVDENGNKLTGSKFKLSGKEYDLLTGEVIAYANQSIISENDIELTYILEETVIPDGYKGLEPKEINIKAKVKKVDNNYKLDKVNLVDGEGKDITDENIAIKLEGSSIVIEVKNTPIPKKLDLALRKFITKINDEEYSREPVVDTSTIATNKTATYKHSKEPIAVKKGDIVTYTIRVYNEGEIDGYVDKITDYVPNNLVPLIIGNESIDQKKYAEEIEFNVNWGWIMSEDGKSITTTKTSKVNSEIYSEDVTDTKLEAYKEGTDKLDYIDVQLKCLVTDKVVIGEYLTNIAEITEFQDINGNKEIERDSKPRNVDYSNLIDYKNNEAINSTSQTYIAGQEDDDDFEKLVVKEYDLSLRKFITGVTRKGKSVNIGSSREPIVNTTTLVNKTSTTASYSHKKDPVDVKIGDTITYTIRVYNEGSIDGIPAEITEYVPTYLDFDPNDETNKKYGWTMEESYDNGIKVLKTNYYNNTVLKAFSYKEGEQLDNTSNYKEGDLKINFIVNKTPTKDTIMTNTTEISKYQDSNKKEAVDRDSGEQWKIGIREYGINLMNNVLYTEYVSQGKLTQEKATEISNYVISVMNEYEPDYTQKDYGLSTYLDGKGITGESFIANAPEGVPEEILEKAYEVINSGDSNAEIAEAYKGYIDKFFQGYKGIETNKDDLSDNKYYYIGQEDDDDFEKLRIIYFDLALRKFVTKVNSVDYNNRYPEIVYNADGSITYKQTKDPVLVTTGDTVVYTIRVYNEGLISGTATEIKDNLPKGLAFDPNNEINKNYGWKMLDENGNITKEAEKVVAFSTEHLKNEVIAPFANENGSRLLSYKDVQIAFVVTETELSDRILVNIAQVSKDSEDDIDSEPNNNIETEDDIDKEYVRVQYFDLSLKKWLKEVKVTVDGKTTTTKTNYKEDSDSIAKVDIVASKLKKTTVKFTYNIKVINEGELPGYAYEIKDYIPTGLKFVAEDNKDWKELEDGSVVTDKLKDTLLNPGESATVEIVLTWKNSSTNFGLKTNYAEISNDSANDKDSTPDNFDFTEDDIDDAQVLLAIKTSGTTSYIGLILSTVAILALGVILIKKYVIE